MPALSTKDSPEMLRPYLFHKLELAWAGTADAQGNCPFCGREKLFFVNQANGLYSCRTCGSGIPGAKEGGNVYTFIRTLHRLGTVSDEDLAEAARDRRVPPSVLKEWGLTRSPVDFEWILPAYGLNKEINNLYRWSPVKGKRRLMGTAGLDARLFGLQFWDTNKQQVFICEGVWDAMCLRWKLGSARRNGDRIVRTTDPNNSLLATYNVVGVPGCETFRDEWLEMFTNQHVTILYHSDYPKTPPSGKLQLPVGFAGTKMAARKLRPVAASIRYLCWGPEGYDPSLPSGYDVRDLLTHDATPATVGPDQAGT